MRPILPVTLVYSPSGVHSTGVGPLRNKILQQLSSYPSLGPEASAILVEQYMKEEDRETKNSIELALKKASDPQGLLSSLLKVATKKPVSVLSIVSGRTRETVDYEQLALVAKTIQTLNGMALKPKEFETHDSVILELAESIYGRSGTDSTAIAQLVGKSMGPGVQEKVFESLVGNRRPNPTLALLAFRQRPELGPALLPKLLESVKDPVSGRPRAGVFPFIEEIRGTLSFAWDVFSRQSRSLLSFGRKSHAWLV